MPVKPLLAVGLILTGCGGSGSGNWQQIRGDGFRFDAPAGWRVAGDAASGEGAGRVQVSLFTLVRPYDRAQRAAVGRELDGVASRLAGQLRGRTTRRGWLRVAGLDARGYTIEFAGRVEEITFALDGRREYQLLCRRTATGDGSACGRLVASFTPA